MKIPAKLLAASFLISCAHGALVEKAVTYEQGGVTLEGFHVYDDAVTGKIPAKVLVLHGAVDPYVPAEQVAAFQKEMTDAKADWQMVYYSGAVHSFTHPEAGDDPSKGSAYQEAADRRSWVAMKTFFAELFE